MRMSSYYSEASTSQILIANRCPIQFSICFRCINCFRCHDKASGCWV